jgi:hypothetical protein
MVIATWLTRAIFRSVDSERNYPLLLIEQYRDGTKVKDWKFYTQKKDHDMKLKEQGWDFYAEGEVKEVKRKCLNEAIQGVGGPEDAIADGDI